MRAGGLLDEVMVCSQNSFSLAVPRERQGLAFATVSYVKRPPQSQSNSISVFSLSAQVSRCHCNSHVRAPGGAPCS